MKKCQHCGELNGDIRATCFKCKTVFPAENTGGRGQPPAMGQQASFGKEAEQLRALLMEEAEGGSPEQPERYENLPVIEAEGCVFCGQPLPEGEAPACTFTVYPGISYLVGQDEKRTKQLYRRPGWAYVAPACKGCAKAQRKHIHLRRPLFMLAGLAALVALGLLALGVTALYDSRNNILMLIIFVLGFGIFSTFWDFIKGTAVLCGYRAFGKTSSILAELGTDAVKNAAKEAARTRLDDGIADNRIFVLDSDGLKGLPYANQAALIACGVGHWGQRQDASVQEGAQL